MNMNMNANLHKLLGAAAFLGLLLDVGCGGTVDLSPLKPRIGGPNGASDGGAGPSGSSGAPGSSGALGNSGAPGGGGTTGSSGASGNAPCTNSASVARGAGVYAGQFCGSCHGVAAQGAQGPNITMSQSAGIGDWTYQDFSDALRFSVRPDGTRLCAFMATYPPSDISEPDVQDLFAYLQCLPINDKLNQGTYCP